MRHSPNQTAESDGWNVEKGKGSRASCQEKLSVMGDAQGICRTLSRFHAFTLSRFAASHAAKPWIHGTRTHDIGLLAS